MKRLEKKLFFSENLAQKLFYAQLSMKLQLLIKTKRLIYHATKCLNVNNIITVGILTFMSMIKFMLH